MLSSRKWTETGFGSLIGVRTMSNETSKFNKLSPEIRNLIRDGVYAFYRIAEGQDSGKYLLITDDKKFFLLNAEGAVIKELSSLPDSRLQKATLGQSTFLSNQRKLNYA